MASWGGGLLYYDNKLRSFPRVYKDIKDIQNINDTIWIATHGDGVQLIDVKTKSIINRNNLPYNLQLPKWGNVILYDTHKNIWIGTAVGLYKFKNGKTFFYSKELWDNDVCSLHEDCNGNIWIGTSTGLQYYNPQNNQIHQVSKHILSESINAIVSYKQYLFINTENGFCKINIKDFTLVRYSVNDGLPSNVLIRNALYKKDSLLYIGTTQGFAILNMAKNHVDKSKPVIVISEITITDEKNTTTNLSFIDNKTSLYLKYYNTPY